MMTKPVMKAYALEAQAKSLDTAAAELRLTQAMGLSATQRDVNRLRAYLMAEAGKLRAKRLALEEAEKQKKRRKAANEGTEMSAQGLQTEAQES